MNGCHTFDPQIRIFTRYIFNREDDKGMEDFCFKKQNLLKKDTTKGRRQTAEESKNFTFSTFNIMFLMF